MVKKIEHKELGNLIKTYYEHKISLMIYGRFGIGKSQLIRETAKEIAKKKNKNFVEWNKISKQEKQDLFNNPEKHFVLIDIRLSEFDGCLTGDMPITLSNGKVKPIKDLKEGEEIIGFKEGNVVIGKVIKKWDKGLSKQGIAKLHLENGSIIKATKQHKFLTMGGWKKTKDLRTSDILYIQTLKDYQNEDIHETRKGIYQEELSEENGIRNRERVRKKPQISNLPRFEDGNTKTISEIYGRGDKNNKRELQQNECEKFSKNDVSEQIGNKHISERFKNSEELWGSNERERINFKQPNRSRERILGGNNRRRGEHNFEHTETIRQREQDYNRPIQTKNLNQQYGQKTIRMVSKQNEDKICNIQKKRTTKQKDKFVNRNERLQNSPNIKNITSPIDNKKRTSRDTDRLDRKKEEIKMEGHLHRVRQKTTFTDKKIKFEPTKIQRIDFTNENRQIFDITTTTGNYLVCGVVCHNSDIKGLPVFNDNKESIDFKCPMWALYMTQKKSDGILFADELNLAVPIVISSFYKILHDKIINEMKASEDWFIIGAGNTEDDNAYIHELASPIKDRVGEVELIIPSVDAWTEWAVKHNIDSKIVGYINFKQSNLWNVDFESKMKYCTPRGWERVSRLIESIKGYDELELITSSAIGEGVASEFVAFVKIQEEIKLDDLIKNPEKIKKLPENEKTLGIKYFIVSAVADKYRTDKVDFEKVVKISKVLDEINNAEFVSLLWRLCLGYKEKEFKEDFMSDKLDKKFAEKYSKWII